MDHKPPDSKSPFTAPPNSSLVLWGPLRVFSLSPLFEKWQSLLCFLPFKNIHCSGHSEGFFQVAFWVVVFFNSWIIWVIYLIYGIIVFKAKEHFQFLKPSFLCCAPCNGHRYHILLRLIWIINKFSIFLACMHAKSLQSSLFVTPWTVASIHRFSRQKYWNGLAFPSPGDLPDPGIEPGCLLSPALAGSFFTTSATWKAFLRANIS